MKKETATTNINFRKYAQLFKGKKGIEIGGPSPIFKSEDGIPIYVLIDGLDGCNFSASTIWEGSIQEGINYHYRDDKVGYQYINDGTELNRIPSGTYDFVISSNCLEHIANPLKALTEWIRIIKPGGLILLVLPDKETNFDHNRPITTLGHLIDDYHRNVGEEDLTHLQEILELHDLPMDPPAGTYEDFKARSLLNLENRALHHHVFNISLLRDICEQIHLRILLSSKIKSDNMVLAIKGSGLLPPTVRFYYYRMLLSYYHRRKNI